MSLSILFSSVPGKIQSAFQWIAPSADFQSALRAPQGDPTVNGNFIKGVVSAEHGGTPVGFGNALADSSFVQKLDPRLAKPFLVGFSEAMDLVFLIGSGVVVLAFVVLWFLPHVELRSGSAYSERGQSDAAAAAEAGAPAPGIVH